MQKFLVFVCKTKLHGRLPSVVIITGSMMCIMKASKQNGYQKDLVTVIAAFLITGESWVSPSFHDLETHILMHYAVIQYFNSLKIVILKIIISSCFSVSNW